MKKRIRILLQLVQVWRKIFKISILQFNKLAKEYEDIIKKSKTDRERFDKFKAAYGALKNDREPKIAAVKAELAKLEKELETKAYMAYKQKEKVIYFLFLLKWLTTDAEVAEWKFQHLSLVK